MENQITMSTWVFIVILVIAVWSILDRVLIPSFRWFLRRRINRVIDEISTRLDIAIKPFQLTKRQVLIDRLAYDPRVIEAIQRYSTRHNMPREVGQAKILHYAREIVPSFNAYIYFRIGYWVAKRIARLLYRVQVGIVSGAETDKIDPNATVVFVMNHRSNMDYILVSFLAAERTALSYAVGEWAKIWPLQTLIRSMGAFFVRRKSGNPLYRLVLERYIHMATKEGVCQAVFPEGGLSLNGCLQPPKLGLMDYMLRSFDPDRDRDIIFIPVGINYDRTLEDRSLIRSLDPSAQKRSKWFVMKTTSRFVMHNLMLMTRNKWKRFGYACVNFGSYISAREYCRAEKINFSRLERDVRFLEVEKLCRRLMVEIEAIIPVIPVPLVADVLLRSSGQWLHLFDLKALVHDLIEKMETCGAPVNIPQEYREKAIEEALHMLMLRRMVERSEDRYRTNAEMLDLLRYYANSIAHRHAGPENTR